jgi:hypothetical protein
MLCRREQGADDGELTRDDEARVLFYFYVQ